MSTLSKQQPISVSILTLGTMKENNGRKIYITNKKLSNVYEIGEKVSIVYDYDNKQIKIKPADFMTGTHTISSKGNGTPVLDIKNRKVAETFGSDVEKVEVLFYKDEIIIKVSKTEKFKAQRKNKKGLNTFELFCGAGTLSNFFKRAGFNIIGGLELNQDYVSLFHENNEGDEIYTINGKLEDVHTSYFPKNVDVVLCGIPCTKYSPSNLALKKAQKAKRSGFDFDEKKLEEEYEAEALTFYVLTAIRAMNPKTIVVEEVPEYSEAPSSMMLRTVLKQMGYNINEAVSEGSNTKRKRWTLVADMDNAIELDNLICEKTYTIEHFLETSIEDRNWQTADENLRVAGMIRKGLGIRSCLPTDYKVNTFTTHSTRHTEPILKHPNKELYSEFTNREIAKIHGLPNTFVLDPRVTISRQILGQGVTDMFYTVAQRIKNNVFDIKFKNNTRTICGNEEIIDLTKDIMKKLNSEHLPIKSSIEAFNYLKDLSTKNIVVNHISKTHNFSQFEKFGA